MLFLICELLYIYACIYATRWNNHLILFFIGDLSDLFQQLHPEPVKLKKVRKNHHPYSTLTTSMNLENKNIN